MKRGAVIGIAAGAAALVLAGGVAWWLLARAPGPDAAAQDFLAALAEGDGERAVAMIHDAPGSHGSAIEALASADALIEEPEIESIGSAEGETTRANVTFRLDGELHTATFGLVEDGGAWRIAADALGIVTVTTTLGDSVRVGDVLIPAGAEAALLPASYSLTPAPADLLSGRDAAVVLPGSHEQVAIEASLSLDATALAQEQLDAYAEACTQPVTAVPPNCGIRVPWPADLATLDAIAFRVEQLPVVALSPDARTFAATEGVVVATATGTTRDDQTGSFTYRADDWALRGTILFTGDEMVLRVG